MRTLAELGAIALETEEGLRKRGLTASEREYVAHIISMACQSGMTSKSVLLAIVELKK